MSYPPRQNGGNMNDTNKRNRQSKLEQLPPETQSGIIEAAAHSRLADTLKILQAEGIETSISALSRFVREHREKILLEDGKGMKASVEALAERVDRAGRELEQRERTLASATEHIARTSELRRQVEDAALALEDRSRQLQGSLAATDERAASIAELADRLDARAGALRVAEQRLARFEEQVARLEAAERALTASIEELGQRQGSVDAARAELTRLLELVSRATQEMRELAAAHAAIKNQVGPGS